MSKHSCLDRVLPVLIALVLPGPVFAQDHTLLFGIDDPGVSKAITNWGMDTGVFSYDVARRDLIFMGTNMVNFVQVVFEANAALTNNDLTYSQKVDLTNEINLAKMATAANQWILSSGTGAGVDPWYQSGAGTVFPDRWAAMMSAWQRNYNKTFWFAQPFNEPDWGWGQGSQQNLYDIIGFLQTSNNFAGTDFGGGCTLDCDQANAWYNFISNRVAFGTTHTLNGSVYSYVNFIQNVLARGATPINPEAHNVCEAILGAEYGLRGVSWWLAAERTRGEFANACQGKRLAYADDWPKWTAAAVYRQTNSAINAFLGSGERHSLTTTYRFFSKDRDVFYDGDGPRRDYTVSILPNQEKLINITSGTDVQPKISGRYLIVNRNSHKVLEVPGANTNWGVLLDQSTFTNGNNQLWDVYPIGGIDASYYSMIAVHSGSGANLYYNGFNPAASYDNGTGVLQYGTGGAGNEHWYFEYAGNGYFKIRSGWSKKVLGVSGASLNNGAIIVQWDDNGSLDQQWRLVPAAFPGYDFLAPGSPAGLTATTNAVSVQLHWNANSEPDLAGYTVLRGKTNGGPYTIVARGLVTNGFTDKSANEPGTYYYVVQAVDRSLNASAFSSQVSATTTAGPALMAQYSFNGSLSDSSVNANHPIVTNGTPTFVAGKYGSAMDLNGTDQYIMLPANMFASVTNFTIAALVNWDGGGAWQRIFDFGNDTIQYMFLTPSSGSGTLRFAMSTNGSAPGAEQILETAAAPVGQWLHVAVTRNGNSARLYTNGVVAASGTVSIAPAKFNPALNYLGKSQYPDPLFNGRLDEVFVYNYALSDTEVARLSTNMPPPPVAPTTLSTSFNGNSLSIAWPSNYLGSRLESNSIGLTATSSWFTVSGSMTTNRFVLPVNLSLSNVFFRLAYP